MADGFTVANPATRGAGRGDRSGQDSPFSKGPPEDTPKKPGRQPGKDYGKKAHRPLPDQPSDEILDLPPPQVCPECGGATVEGRAADYRMSNVAKDSRR